MHDIHTLPDSTRTYSVPGCKPVGDNAKPLHVLNRLAALALSVIDYCFVHM
jgi:hypothetical protein